MCSAKTGVFWHTSSSVETKLADAYAEILPSDPRERDNFAKVSANSCEDAREIGVREYLAYQLNDRESEAELLVASLMVSFLETCPELYNESLELVDTQAVLERLEK